MLKFIANCKKPPSRQMGRRLSWYHPILKMQTAFYSKLLNADATSHFRRKAQGKHPDAMRKFTPIISSLKQSAKPVSPITAANIYLFNYIKY